MVESRLKEPIHKAYDWCMFTGALGNNLYQLAIPFRRLNFLPRTRIVSSPYPFLCCSVVFQFLRCGCIVSYLRMLHTLNLDLNQDLCKGITLNVISTRMSKSGDYE